MNKRIISAIISIVLVIVVAYFYEFNGEETNRIEQVSVGVADSIDINNDKLNIIFFYVGQADSTLIKLNDNIMLIDAGNNEDGINISKYLKQIGVTKIDCLIGTHCDEDHIGGLDDIIDSMDVESVYIPEIGNGETNYNNVINSANKKNIPIINPKEGDKFQIGEANCEVLSALNTEGTSDNNSSIVIEMRYIDTTYLFMGDAEKEIENSKTWNHADVLKVGHHGSNTSSTEKFLAQVRPTYSVIQVGKDNRYRLPNRYTIERLENIGTNILRTDMNESSFWFTSDGHDIEAKEVNVNLDGNKKK